MTKFKCKNKIKILKFKTKFCHLCFDIWIYFVICALTFGFACKVYALNIDKVKVNFLSGDYKAAISEGEKIIASADHSPDLDELYYILGLSYLKETNYLRASDIFEIILKEFKESKFQEESTLGLGDTYFLRGDLTRAEGYYKGLINSNAHTKFKAALYYRLSEIEFKKGEAQNGKEYLEKLRQEFPLYAESKLNSESTPQNGFPSGAYYTVQVGCFTNRTNADNITQKLIQKGYPAYIEEADSQQPKSYRVRVGKSKTRQEALALEKQLSQEGFPTKVYP